MKKIVFVFLLVVSVNAQTTVSTLFDSVKKRSGIESLKYSGTSDYVSEFFNYDGGFAVSLRHGMYLFDVHKLEDSSVEVDLYKKDGSCEYDHLTRHIFEDSDSLFQETFERMSKVFAQDSLFYVFVINEYLDYQDMIHRTTGLRSIFDRDELYAVIASLFQATLNLDVHGGSVKTD